MEAITKLGIETARNLYVFPMIGFNVYLMYLKDKGLIQVCDDSTGTVIREHELSFFHRNMNFNEFVHYAKNVYKHNIETFPN